MTVTERGDGSHNPNTGSTHSGENPGKNKTAGSIHQQPSQFLSLFTDVRLL